MQTDYHNLFVSSPGDLDREREVIKNVVEAFNRWAVVNDRLRVEIVDSNSVVPAFGRAQQLINSRLMDCDLTVVLFKERWGSKPDHSGPYTSGTEEEFFEAVKLYMLDATRMQGIGVFFLEADEPDHHLTDFKRELRASYSFMYKNTNERDFEADFASWLKEKHEKQYVPPTALAIRTSTGERILRPFGRLVEARRAALMGEADRATHLFRKAAEVGGASEKLELAKHLRRIGQQEDAKNILESVREANQNEDLLSRISVLTNLEEAKILLNEGKHQDVVDKLSLMRGIPDTRYQDPRSVAELFDTLGRAYTQTGNLNGAGECYEKAYRIRRRIKDQSAISFSIINLARNQLQQANPREAAERLSQLTKEDTEKLEPSLLANQYLLKAQIEEANSDYDNAAESANQSYRFNELASNVKGMIYARSVQSKVASESGDYESAIKFLVDCFRLNEQQENNFGMNQCRQRIKDLCARYGLEEPEL